MNSQASNSCDMKNIFMRTCMSVLYGCCVSVLDPTGVPVTDSLFMETIDIGSNLREIQFESSTHTFFK